VPRFSDDGGLLCCVCVCEGEREYSKVEMLQQPWPEWCAKYQHRRAISPLQKGADRRTGRGMFPEGRWLLQCAVVSNSQLSGI
jgi:hypothetical protein